jgi:hypothetical protein
MDHKREKQKREKQKREKQKREKQRCQPTEGTCVSALAGPQELDGGVSLPNYASS